MIIDNDAVEQMKLQTLRSEYNAESIEELFLWKMRDNIVIALPATWCLLFEVYEPRVTVRLLPCAAYSSTYPTSEAGTDAPKDRTTNR